MIESVYYKCVDDSQEEVFDCFVMDRYIQNGKPMGCKLLEIITRVQALVKHVAGVRVHER